MAFNRWYIQEVLREGKGGGTSSGTLGMLLQMTQKPDKLHNFLQRIVKRTTAPGLLE